MDAASIIRTITLIALPLIFAITLHEAAHGYIANKLGDRTALMLGRVTLNPIKHIDPFGTIILPLIMIFISRGTFIFGWAKPVPVNWANLRRPRRDMALVALAGPAANLAMAFFWALVAKLATITPMVKVEFKATATFFIYSGIYGILINCVLMILNLIPIPPLDGSRVISAILPPRLSYKYDMIEPYGIWILIGVIFLGGKYLLFPPVMALLTVISNLFGLTSIIRLIFGF